MKSSELNVAGIHRLNMTCEEVWRSLNDPCVLQQCISKCETVEKLDESNFSAVFSVKIGPFKKTFNANLQVVGGGKLGEYCFLADMSSGVLGEIHGVTWVSLTEDGEGTLLEYDARIQLHGWFANLGGRMLENTAKRHMAGFVEKLERSGVSVVARIR